MATVKGPRGVLVTLRRGGVLYRGRVLSSPDPSITLVRWDVPTPGETEFIPTRLLLPVQEQAHLPATPESRAR